MLFGQRRMHQPPGFLAQRLQLARQAFALRLVLHNEPAVPRPPTIVSEAQEGEGLRPPLAAPLSSHAGKRPNSISRVFSSCSVRPNVASRSSRASNISSASCRVLEAHDEVVGVAHDHDATACVTPPPLVDPEIEDIMQEDVGEERADARPLRRSPVRFVPLPALQNAGLAATAG